MNAWMHMVCKHYRERASLRQSLAHFLCSSISQPRVFSCEVLLQCVLSEAWYYFRRPLETHRPSRGIRSSPQRCFSSHTACQDDASLGQFLCRLLSHTTMSTF